MREGGGTPVRRSSLRQQIADALRDEILTGRLQAGRRFTVKEIAETYGVSATPVREALVDLAAQGLLEVEQHRGFQVRRFTAADFHSLTEARAFVVDAAFRWMGEHGMGDLPADSLASVRRRAEAAERAARAGVLDVLIGCDLRFWGELAAIGGNPHLCEFLDRVRTQTWIYAVPHLRAVPDLAGVCWSEHVALVDAVAARDTAQAQQLTHEYHVHHRALIERLAPADPTGQPPTGQPPTG
jgi:DNA-binding GntR family transcriptional regulator